MNNYGIENDKGLRFAIEHVCKNTVYEEISSTDVQNRKFPHNGKFLVRELPIDYLVEDKSFSALNPKYVEKLSRAKLTKLGQFIFLSKLGTITKNRIPECLRTDAAIIVVKNGKIVKSKTFEIDGECHTGPIQYGNGDSVDNFIKTIISDTIKDILLSPVRIRTFEGDTSLALRVFSEIMKEDKIM